MPIKPHTPLSHPTSPSDYVSLERFSVIYVLSGGGRSGLTLSDVVADIGMRPDSMIAAITEDMDCERCRRCDERGFFFRHAEGVDTIAWRNTQMAFEVPALSKRDWEIRMIRKSKCEVAVVLTFARPRA